jgi:hypothetical protein
MQLQINGQLYRAFVLRWWSEASTDEMQAAWRFIMEEVGDQPARHAFVHLSELVAFIETELQKESLFKS